MQGIKEFFKRIQNAHTKEMFVRSVIQETIAKHTTITIPITSIGFNGSVMTLKNISPALRSVIFIKKPSLLRDINQNQDSRKITDIR